MPHPLRPRRGFTLFEMVVVIAIVAIIASTLLPVLVKPYMGQRAKSTIEEMAAIQEAVIGRPELGDWGFLGTVGRLPAPIQELQGNPNAIATATFSGLTGLLSGWNGPYLRANTLHPLLDGWGNVYQIDTDTGGQWRIRSAGPNGVFSDADDIVLPQGAAWFHSQGGLQVELLTASWNVASRIPNNWLSSVRLYYPDGNGGEACTGDPPAGCPGTFDPTTGTFSNTSIPFGLHVLEVQLDAVESGCVAPNCNLYRKIPVRRPANLVAVHLPSPPRPVPSVINCVQGNLNVSPGPSTSGCSVTLPTYGAYLITAHVTGRWQVSAGSGVCYVQVNYLAATSGANGSSPQVSTRSTTYTTLSAPAVFEVPGTGVDSVDVWFEGSVGSGGCDLQDSVLTVSVLPR